MLRIANVRMQMRMFRNHLKQSWPRISQRRFFLCLKNRLSHIVKTIKIAQHNSKLTDLFIIYACTRAHIRLHKIFASLDANAYFYENVSNDAKANADIRNIPNTNIKRTLCKLVVFDIHNNPNNFRCVGTNHPWHNFPRNQINILWPTVSGINSWMLKSTPVIKVVKPRRRFSGGLISPSQVYLCVGRYVLQLV